MDTVVRLAADSTKGAASGDDSDDDEEQGARTPRQRDPGDAIIIIDAASEITFMNGTAEQLTGWSAAEARGSHLTEVVSVQDEVSGWPIIETLLWRARKEGFASLCEAAALVSRDYREYPIGGSIVAARGH